MAVDGDRGRRAEALDDLAHQLPELGRDGVADRVGDVERARTRIDRGLVDLHQEVEIGARRILGAELDLGVRPEGLAPVRDPLRGRKQRVVTRDAQLVLEVDVAAGDEDVEVRPLGNSQRLDGALRIAILAARQAGDGHSPGFAGDRLDRLELARRRGREAGLDDVHVEADELAGDLDLLRHGEPGPGRLLAVAKSRVEDSDGARDYARATYGRRRRRVRSRSSRTPSGLSPWTWRPPAAGRRRLQRD